MSARSYLLPSILIYCRCFGVECTNVRRLRGEGSGRVEGWKGGRVESVTAAERRASPPRPRRERGWKGGRVESVTGGECNKRMHSSKQHCNCLGFVTKDVQHAPLAPTDMPCDLSQRPPRNDASTTSLDPPSRTVRVLPNPPRTRTQASLHITACISARSFSDSSHMIYFQPLER